MRVECGPVVVPPKFFLFQSLVSVFALVFSSRVDHLFKGYDRHATHARKSVPGDAHQVRGR